MTLLNSGVDYLLGGSFRFYANADSSSSRDEASFFGSRSPKAA